MFFQRTQAKSNHDKREIIQKLTNFKQNISPVQMKELKNRSFVIVDVKSLKDKKKKS